MLIMTAASQCDQPSTDLIAATNVKINHAVSLDLHVSVGLMRKAFVEDR